MDESWWISTPDGARRRIDAGGITLGRSSRADIVLASERASRMQALVVLSPEGPQLVQLGRGKTLVNDELLDHDRALAHGDVVALPGLRLTATCESDADARAHGWVIQRSDGSRYGVTRSPFRIGGGEDDDLRLEGWPARAAELRDTEGALHVRGTISLDDHGIEDWTELRAGSVLAHGGDQLTIVSGHSIAEKATLEGSRGDGGLGVEVRLEFLPRGGRLFLRSPAMEATVYLPDKRCDLIALLLSPPEPARAGDFVEDDVLLARVWGKELKARTDVNVLVHRLRKDLERAGLDPSWVERQKGGGATRFLLLPGTKVTLV